MFRLTNDVTVSAEKKRMSPWIILIICWLAAMMPGISLNKIAPIIPELMVDFGITTTEAGLLVSAFSISALVLALPVGMIATRLGAYQTGIVGLACAVAGALLGSLTEVYTVLFVSRLLEGASLILMGTVCPSIVMKAFPPNKVGTAMGVMVSYLPISQVIAFFIFPRLYPTVGWSGVAVITALLPAVMLALWLLAMRPFRVREKGKAAGAAMMEALKHVLRNKYLWLMGILFLLYQAFVNGQLTFLTKYLQDVRGFDAVTAGDYGSYYSAACFVMVLLMGVICDKVGSYKKPLIVIALGGAVAFILMPNVPNALTLAIILMWAGFIGGVGTIGFASVPGLVQNPEYNTMGVSVINLCEKLGIVIGVPLYSGIIETAGWSMTFYVSAGLVLSTLVLLFLNKRLK